MNTNIDTVRFVGTRNERLDVESLSISAIDMNTIQNNEYICETRD